MLCRLYWWRLRTQPAQEALAVVGIAAGVALIFAVEIANTSVPASVRDLVHGIAGPASLEIAARTPEGFDERLMSKVGGAPGVFGDLWHSRRARDCGRPTRSARPDFVWSRSRRSLLSADRSRTISRGVRLKAPPLRACRPWARRAATRRACRHGRPSRRRRARAWRLRRSAAVDRRGWAPGRRPLRWRC